MVEGILIGALVAALAAAGYFFLRYSLLRRSLRDADCELSEIVEDLGENRIVKLAAPDRDLEALLGTVNRALARIRSEAVRYARREADLKSQIERISHDLRTPLTSILGYLALVDERGLSEETRESLAIVRRKADSLQRLIGQFYELSCVRGEDYLLDLGEVEVGRLVKESIAGQYRLLSETGLDVSVSVPPDAVIAWANDAAVERVVANLVHNAGRYAKTTFEVRVFEDSDKGIVLLSFANDVESLDEGDVSRLFEPFYMVDGSRTQESSGLGLTIARHLVERMGGTLTAQTEVRDGAQWLRFEVALALAASTGVKE